MSTDPDALWELYCAGGDTTSNNFIGAVRHELMIQDGECHCHPSHIARECLDRLLEKMPAYSSYTKMVGERRFGLGHIMFQPRSTREFNIPHAVKRIFFHCIQKERIYLDLRDESGQIQAITSGTHGSLLVSATATRFWIQNMSDRSVTVIVEGAGE